MRIRISQGQLTVQFIIGSRCVLFGMSAADALGTRPDFLGFAIHRKNLGTREEHWLPNFLCFKINERKPSQTALLAALPKPEALENEQLIFTDTIRSIRPPALSLRVNALIAGHAPIYGSDENPFQAF